MILKFTSKAIENIDPIDNNNVIVTWKGNRPYNYRSADVSGFVRDVNNVITEEGSVGTFVNTAIRNKVLKDATKVTA